MVTGYDRLYLKSAFDAILAGRDVSSNVADAEPLLRGIWKNIAFAQDYAARGGTGTVNGLVADFAPIDRIGNYRVVQTKKGRDEQQRRILTFLDQRQGVEFCFAYDEQRDRSLSVQSVSEARLQLGEALAENGLGQKLGLGYPDLFLLDRFSLQAVNVLRALQLGRYVLPFFPTVAQRSLVYKNQDNK
ncbi:TPA: hypothetical protein HA241_04440 [Candidatus Woesearchaeota archaeon]|nr:hypothetical protein [Candidatus Woesearchaeota archaeon]